MAHWAEQYVGRPYETHGFDCMDMVVLVEKEVFGKELKLPVHTFDPIDRQLQIHDGKYDYVERIAIPKDGDCVLFKVRGFVQHVGIVCNYGGERWVLHNAQGKTHSGVQFQPERAMLLRGYAVEGYYRWK